MCFRRTIIPLAETRIGDSLTVTGIILHGLQELSTDKKSRAPSLVSAMFEAKCSLHFPTMRMSKMSRQRGTLCEGASCCCWEFMTNVKVHVFIS